MKDKDLFIQSKCSRKWIFGDNEINGNDRHAILSEIDAFNDDELYQKAFHKSIPNHSVEIISLFSDEPKEIILNNDCKVIDKAQNLQKWSGVIQSTNDKTVLGPGSKLPQNCHITYRPKPNFFGDTSMTYTYVKNSDEIFYETLVFQVIPCKTTLLTGGFNSYNVNANNNNKKIFKVENTQNGSRLNLLENKNTAIDAYGLCLLPESAISKENANHPQSLRFHDIANQLGLTQKQSETRTTPNCIFSSYDHDLDTWDKGGFCMEETLTAGVCVGDIDGDNVDDIYYPRLDGSDVLLLNRHGKQLIDISDISNVDHITTNDVTDKTEVRESGWGWGAFFADLDNDGDLDVFNGNGMDDPETTDDDFAVNQPARLYMNLGRNDKFKFSNEAQTRGIATEEDNRGALTFDFDQDGDLDILVVNHASTPQLFVNTGANYYDYLRVKVLETNGRESIGAKVYLKPTESYAHPDRVIEIGSTAAFLAQGENVAHFGLEKDLLVVHRVKIQWPRINRKNNDGNEPTPVVTFYNVPVRKTLIVSRNVVDKVTTGKIMTSYTQQPSEILPKVFYSSAATLPRCDGNLNIHSISQPSNGRISLDPSTNGIRYIPNANFQGIETLKYVVKNEFGELSQELIAEIHVNNPDIAKNMKESKQQHDSRKRDVGGSNKIFYDKRREKTKMPPPSIEELIKLLNEHQENNNFDSEREKTTDKNVLVASFGAFVLDDVFKVEDSGKILNNKVNGWLDLSTIYSDVDEIHCYDGKLPTPSDITTESIVIDNDGRSSSSTNNNESRYEFKKLWKIIFVAEHNRLVENRKTVFPTWSSVKLYRWARKRNLAQYKALIYYDWLPKLTGLVEYNKVLGKYNGFQKSAKPEISLLFAISLSLVTKIQAMNIISYSSDIGEMLQEAAKIPIDIDMDLINQIDVQEFKKLLQLTRSINLTTYEEVCKKLKINSLMEEHKKSLKLPIVQKLFESYFQDEKNIDYLIGLLIQSITSSSDQLWKYSILSQFKSLREGDLMWYELTESNETKQRISELSLLGFLRKTTGVKSLKVEFNYDKY